MKIRKFGFLIISLIFSLLVSCTPNNVPPTVNGVEARYTITFYEDGGAEVSDINEKFDTPITLPATGRAKYDFLGWYYDYGTYERKCELTKMPAENLVLYAKWEKQTLENLQAYEEEIAKYSEPGHLYIHYKRFEHTVEDYAKWNLWVWAFNETGREFEWMEEEGSIKYDDYGGAVCDIDLTKTYNDGGNDKTETIKYVDSKNNLVEKIGFLIVYKASKLETGHWRSDGGNQYFYTDDGLREDGSIHLFAIQDNVSNYTFSFIDEEVSNPYDNDEGENVSSLYNNVNSSNKTNYAKVRTSNDFASNVGVGYQVMTASFADSDGDGMGDIKGITENLDYLTDTLHVNALWLTPIQLSDSYHAYDIIDYTVVDPKFGSKNTNYPELLDSKGRPTEASAMADYKELLNEADKKGIRVIMDLVINHTSTNNVWFKKSCALDPEYRGFYQWKNHETDFSIASNDNWHKYSTYPYSYYGKFASSMPELNYDYQGTRDAIVDVAKFWLNLGVDGFRIDAVKHIYMKDEVQASSGDVIITDIDKATNVDYSSNLTKNLNFFREFNYRVKAEYPDAAIIGENFDGHAYRVASYYEGLDSMLNFYMYYNLAQSAAAPDNYAYASKISGADSSSGSFNASELGVQYGGAWNFPSTHATNEKYREGVAIESIFTSNHDVARAINCMMGSLEFTSDGTTLVPEIITTSNANEAISKAKVYAAAVMTLPGISWIYYGDELGMSGNYASGETAASPHADRWYRQPFKWGDSLDTKYTTNYTFSGDKTYHVKWDDYNASLKGVTSQKADLNSLLSVYAKLTELKSTDSVLISGSYEVISAGSDVMAFKRTLNGKTYYIYHNFGSKSVGISGASGNVIYSINGASKTSLPGYSSVIIG